VANKSCLEGGRSVKAKQFKCGKAFLIVVCVAFLALTCYAQQPTRVPGKRPVTVIDAITMTRLGLPDGILSGTVKNLAAIFSPDRRRFLIVLKKGNLERNTNDYSILLYETAFALKSQPPVVLFTMSSSSNHEAIRDIKWTLDSRTFLFLGENPGEKTAVYRFNLEKKHLERVTRHVTPVVVFSSSNDGNTILFAADPDVRATCKKPTAPAQEILITTQNLVDILGPACREEFMASTTEGQELFVLKVGRQEERIPVDDVLYQLEDSVSISPDGRYGVIEVAVRDVPADWSQYEASWLRQALQTKRKHGEVEAAIEKRLLVNTGTHEVTPLFNTPVFPRYDRLAWSPDGESLILSGVYLPLDGITDEAERKKRKETTYVVELSVPEKKLQTIATGSVWIRRWEGNTKQLTLARFGEGVQQEEMTFETSGGRWREVTGWTKEAPPKTALEVTIEEDANAPPRIVAHDRVRGEQNVLLDLNPGFVDLALGKVEVIKWNAKDGHEVRGGLFFPPDYVPGRKYPLVIQTHGFLDHKFYIDGPWSSAFAAQPLASRGIMVLQVGYPTKEPEHRFFNTPGEAPEAMGTYEGAIDYLNSRDLIDQDHVGILGFSRTVFTVGYTLTHSRYKFAAATLADGITGGYMGLMAFPYDWNTPALNGGLPFGRGLQLWTERAPEFNLDRVGAPVRLEAYYPGSVLGFWEWFAGLSLQGKPVDFVYLPGASHLLTKPSDRLVSQQGNVDWFCFWLKGEEDPDPAKAEQYARWRELRKLQQENDKKSVATRKSH
jgi:dipeptidyl aminopeptidase/acylaminoacyl peptidase